MRIAIFTSVHAPLDVRIFQKEGSSLAAEGHDVTLLARERAGASIEIEARGIRFIALHGGPSRFARIRLWQQIFMHLRKLDAESWHFHDPELLPFAVVARMILRRRVSLVYDAHEDLPKDILEKHWIPKHSRRVVSRLADRVERWGAGHCDLVIGATDSIGLRMESCAPQAIVVHNYPLQVNVANSSAGGADTNIPVRVIFAGGLSRKRGVMELIAAMRMVHTPSMELHLLGDFLNRAFELELRAACGPNVIVHGEVPFAEVAGHLAAAQIGVITFLPVPNHVEALPNKMFEYMRAGLPIVASDFPLWRPLVLDTGCGVVVDPSKPAEIAAVLDELAADPQRRRTMGERGITCVRERFSWQIAERVLLDAYVELDRQHRTRK